MIASELSNKKKQLSFKELLLIKKHYLKLELPMSISKIFKKKEMPVMPFKASTLMEKYQVPEGRELGQKLKAIEEVWTSNDFKISDKEVQKIVSN